MVPDSQHISQNTLNERNPFISPLWMTGGYIMNRIFLDGSYDLFLAFFQGATVGLISCYLCCLTWVWTQHRCRSPACDFRRSAQMWLCSCGRSGSNWINWGHGPTRGQSAFDPTTWLPGHWPLKISSCSHGSWDFMGKNRGWNRPRIANRSSGHGMAQSFWAKSRTSRILTHLSLWENGQWGLATK